MEFLILGPLEVRAEGRPLALSGPKQRALLAILLLHANEVVSTDRLIDDLWGDVPPNSGTAALQMRVSALRKVLREHGQRRSPSELLVTHPPGYRLRVDAGELDAERFERLLRTGRSAMRIGDAEAASVAIREALSLWRGEPLADFAYEPFAQAEIARLGELRTSAIEDRIDADLELGRHADVIGELDANVVAFPLRERLCGQLMLALYRSDRQAEALAVYHATRRALVDNLGLEPGAALQRLEQRILRQDPALDIRRIELPVPSEDVTPHLPERRKTVTVAVTEYLARGGLPAMDPERLRQIGERFVAAAMVECQRHGGVLNSSSGSSLVAVFGDPDLHEDDALRAVRAAVGLRGALWTLSDELERDFRISLSVRIGIATGEVVTGTLAPGRPRLVGEPLILASQLQQRAAPGEILLADTTRQLTDREVRVEPVRTGHAMQDWRLVEVADHQSVDVPASDVSLVGRIDELAQLHEIFGRAARNRTIHLCSVLGPAGIGKSRLAQEFVSGIADTSTVVVGRCLAYGEGITFWPLREIVRQLAPSGDIAELLAGDADADLVADRIAGAIGLVEATTGVDETFWAVRRLLEAVARDRPLLVLVEDVHWAEPTLRAMLHYLANRIRGAPILLLCLARPELVEGRLAFGAGLVNATTILLEPLAEHESHALMDDRLGPVHLDANTRARINAIAEGNPLFLEQMIAMVVQKGELSDDMEIPPTIQALLAARIDQLGPGERAILERAAIAGREFSSKAIAELLPVDARPTTARHLDTLVGKDFLRSEHAGLADAELFRFRHVLILQSVYGSIPKRIRSDLHEAFAGWLDASALEGKLEIEEVVGYHLEQAHRYRVDVAPVTARELDLGRRAGERLASAGRRAFKAGDMPASVNLLGRATALMPPYDPISLELLSDMAYALFEVGNLEQSSSVLAEVIERGNKVDASRLVARAIVQRGHVEMYRHPEAVDAERLLREAAAARRILLKARDDIGLARAATLVSEVEWTLGSGTRATQAAKAAARYSRRSGSRRDEAWSAGDYGYYAVFGPTTVADGTRQMERWLTEAGGDPVLEANLSGFLAPMAAMAGRIPEARERLAESRLATDRLGLRWQTGTHDLLGSFVEMLANDPYAADAHLTKAIDMFTEMGDMWFVSILSIERARALCRQGRHDDAFALLGRLDALPADSGPSYQIRRCEILGRVLYQRNDRAAALASLHEAVERGERTDFLGFHADALVALAEALHAEGQLGDAIRTVGTAIQLYERKGNVVEAGKARAMLLALSG